MPGERLRHHDRHDAQQHRENAFGEIKIACQQQHTGQQAHGGQRPRGQSRPFTGIKKLVEPLGTDRGPCFDSGTTRFGKRRGDSA